jgi:Flp pilus assembly protein TadB
VLILSRLIATVAALLASALLAAPASAAEPTSTELVLVMDTSGSMKGARIAAARKAASALVDELPSTLPIGLISFGTTPSLVVPLTTDHARVIEAIQGLEADGNTALYDAIAEALTLLPETQGRVLVLSDGADTASEISLNQMLRRAVAQRVPIDIVAIKPTDDVGAVLQQIASRTGGTLVSVDSTEDLLAAFQEALDEPIPTPIEPTSVPEPVPTAAPEPTATTSDPLPLLLAGVTCASLLLLFWQFYAWEGRSRRSKLRRAALESYAPTLATASPAISDGLSQEQGAPERFPKTAQRLESAGMSLPAQRWVLLQVFGGALLTLLLIGLMGPLVGILIGVPVSWLIPRAVLTARSAKRTQKFEAELPDFLQVIAASLEAGLPLEQALESAAIHGEREIDRQMRRALAETQMGTPLEKALMATAERMNSEDLRWMVIALSIQREVGGNLSGILRTVATTIKGREELRGEVRTLSAEGRLSAYVLIALPIVMFGILALIRRDYVKILWSEPIGYAMLMTFVILITLGWFWMRRVVTVKV